MKLIQQSKVYSLNIHLANRLSLELAIIAPEPEHCLTYKNTQSICF